eukprot:3194165-Pyramimonas_sp.AAC.1
MAHDDWTWWCVPHAELMIRLVPQLRELAPTEAAIHDMAVAYCRTAWRDAADHNAQRRGNSYYSYERHDSYWRRLITYMSRREYMQ